MGCLEPKRPPKSPPKPLSPPQNSIFTDICLVDKRLFVYFETAARLMNREGNKNKPAFHSGLQKCLVGQMAHARGEIPNAMGNQRHAEEPATTGDTPRTTWNQ